MRTHFEKLSKFGVDAVRSLRQFDAKQAEEHKYYHEALSKGEITQQGYERYIRDLDKAREKFISGYDTQLEEMKSKFAEAVDLHTTPSGGSMNMADVEILKNFELSPKEFESLARKYENNATMSRMLEKYRTDHGVNTEWRYQTADQRKEIFNGACDSVYFIMKQSDKYCPEREASVEHRTAAAYHKLQGSIAELMPIPDAPTTAHGTVICGDTAVVTGVSDTGKVYTCF